MQLKLKIAAVCATLLLSSGVAVAEETLVEAMFTPLRQKEVHAVTNKQYKDECGSCHFAYPPGLLPTQSWEKLLNESALAEHFGENAELEADVLTPIKAYVMENAADKSYYKRARKIAKATEGVEAPLRITEVRYIKRKHHEIPERMVKGNKDVKSLSYCDACHTQADKGVFDEDTVRIPNFPDWDD